MGQLAAFPDHYLRPIDVRLHIFVIPPSILLIFFFLGYLLVELQAQMTEVASNANPDMLTELLIAKLLEDDMRSIENTRAAEEFQFHEALNSSVLAAGRLPKKLQPQSGTNPVRQTDHDLAMDVLAAEINANKDALIAQALQHADDRNMAVSRQYAQKLAAAEKKYLLDAEFAKRLQQEFDEGEDDEQAVRDAERCRRSSVSVVGPVADMVEQRAGSRRH